MIPVSPRLGTASAIVCAALLLLGVMATAVPAGAAPAERPRAAVCGTVDLTDTEALAGRADSADAVFAGEVVAVERVRVPDATGGGATRAWRHRVQVLEDYQGVLGDGSRVKVDVAAGPDDSPSDPTSLTAGNTYLFFVTEDGNRLVADPCSGAVLLRSGLTEPVADQLNAAFDAAPSSVEVTLERASGTSEDPPELGRLVAPGAALALIGLLGLLLVSRLGRERR